ncbi:MAG: hypothetical protein ACTS73_08505 [Arsenophonus sp. NEOnobi-MAG3]
MRDGRAIHDRRYSRWVDFCHKVKAKTVYPAVQKASTYHDLAVYIQ